MIRPVLPPIAKEVLQEASKGLRNMSFCAWNSGEKYRDHWEHGFYACSKCENPLFSSRTKFAHHSPWPSFTDTVKPDSLSKVPDGSPLALKVACGKCGNSLGHEFVKDGPGGKSRF